METHDSRPTVSVIIPTYNGAKTISRCLDALHHQNIGDPFEIIVVNDGSTDNTLQVLARYGQLRVVSQANGGPAAARNRGSRDASGEIILFTDDDCEPTPDWLSQMVQPFDDPDVVGSKGTYRTHQREIIARFVQTEYEDRYRFMSRRSNIDFIDTYSAAFRRRQFLETGGYDVSFPVACAEDVELSYRMSRKGWRMVFAPAAVVYHQHPSTLARYLKKKIKFAFWRVVAVKKNPAKALKDSHTPQMMKLQMLLAPALPAALIGDFFHVSPMSLIMMVILLFGFTSLPFSSRAFARDRAVGILAPFILASRSLAQFIGVASAVCYLLIGSTLGFFSSAATRSPQSSGTRPSSSGFD